MKVRDCSLILVLFVVGILLSQVRAKLPWADGKLAKVALINFLHISFTQGLPVCIADGV